MKRINKFVFDVKLPTGHVLNGVSIQGAGGQIGNGTLYRFTDPKRFTAEDVSKTEARLLTMARRNASEERELRIWCDVQPSYEDRILTIMGTVEVLACRAVPDKWS